MQCALNFKIIHLVAHSLTPRSKEFIDNISHTSLHILQAYHLIFCQWENCTRWCEANLAHCGRVTQICVFNTVKLGTSASSP